MTSARELASSAARELEMAVLGTAENGDPVNIAEQLRWAEVEALVAIAIALTEPRPEPAPRVVRL